MSTTLDSTTIALRDPEGALEARFAVDAGMVGCSLRHRGEELLDTRAGLRDYAEKGATMGIPLLHPWANRLADFGYSVNGHDVRLSPSSPIVLCDEHGVPIHGLLPGRRRWTVREASSAHLRAELDFASDPELLAAFPFPHVLEIDARIGGGALEIATTVTAASDDPVPVALGWHPYLRLPNVARRDWEIRLPVRRRLVLDERQIPTGVTEDVEPFDGPLGDRVFDDGFDRLDQPAVFVLRGGGSVHTGRVRGGAIRWPRYSRRPTSMSSASSP